MTVKNGLPPIHPGEFLKEALEELGASKRNSHEPSAFRPCGFPMSSRHASRHCGAGPIVRPGFRAIAAILAQSAGGLRPKGCPKGNRRKAARGASPGACVI